MELHTAFAEIYVRVQLQALASQSSAHIMSWPILLGESWRLGGLNNCGKIEASTDGLGYGDAASRLIIGRIGVVIWLIGVLNLITKSP